jgi:hypothetical protein
VTQVISWGSLYYAFAVLALPIQDEFGWGSSTVMGAFSLALLVWGLAAYPVGVAVHRWGGRGVMTLGSMLAGLSLLALGHTESIITFYALCCGLGVAMAMTLYEPAFAIIVRHHPRSQRRSIGVLTLAGGLASTVFWPLTYHLVAAMGWRETLLIFAALHLLACTPVHAWLLPSVRLAVNELHAPTAAQSAAAGSNRGSTFGLLAGAFTAYGFIAGAMAVQVIPALESCGLTTAQAVALAACIGPMQVAGRAADLVAGDRISALRLGTIALTLIPLALGSLWCAQWAPVLCAVFVVAYGVGLGLLTLVRAGSTLALFGPLRYAKVSGALGAPAVAARAASPLGTAWLLVALGGHGPFLLALLLISAAGTWMFLRAWSTSRLPT